MVEKRTVWVVYTNSDLTEGRGREFPIAYCKSEITAKRIGKGAYVQGLNCPIKSMEVDFVDGNYFMPRSLIHVMEPSYQDLVDQETLNAKNAVLERVRAAGLTDQDLALLGIEIK